MSTPLQDALAVGKQLVSYCQQGKFREAIVDLYADDAKHVEAAPMGDMPAENAGKEKLLGMNDWWEGAHEVHGMDLKGPYPHGSGKFAVWMSIDVTAKQGPTAGKRMQMHEVCPYTVENGKITLAEFFWNPEDAEG